MYYLNTSSTKKVSDDVADYICKYMKDRYYNPSDLYGKDVARDVEYAQDKIREFLGGLDDDKVIFTGSGSEANTMALQGWHGPVYTTPIEHKSIVNQPNVCKNIMVDSRGKVILDELEEQVETISQIYDNILFSIGLANNEIGTMQDIKKISKIVHQRPNCFLHVDATQAFLAMRNMLIDTEIDMISTSFHKIGAPKGIGMLYIRDDIEIDPLIYGGQQMYGIRGGTENTPYIVGVSYLLDNIKDKDLVPIYHSADELIAKIDKRVTDYILNGSYRSRIPGHISISFAGIEGSTLAAMLETDGILVSAGSACNSKSLEASHVLTAIGVPDEYKYGTIRITFDEPIPDEDLDYIADRIAYWVETIRKQNEEEG